MKNDKPQPVVYDDWLAVSTDGFASMNAGRPPEHLVKELVQNSLDAIGQAKGTIHLDFAPGQSGQTILITCGDNGCGMQNPGDIRTVFFTTKTDSHLQRGRMGRGFKEMLCLALWATVTSKGQKIEFVVENGQRITRQSTLPAYHAMRGTSVAMEMPWPPPPDVIPQLQRYFETLLPPGNVELIVNGKAITQRSPIHVIETTLPTERFEDGKWIRPFRQTTIELVALNQGEESLVYEMGIPVCPSDWSQPFHINVLQRVPMNPCRDAVASGYLVKVHRACLPVLLPQMPPEEVLQDWVGNAAPGSPPELQQEVITRGFGQNIARSVPKMGARQFDEDAREIGVKVVDTKQTSGGFRELLQNHVPTTRQVVDQHNQELVTAAASGGFGVADVYERKDNASQQRRKLIDAVGGKERVEQVIDFARWFCQKLLDGYGDGAICSVALALLKPVNAVATWSQDDVLTLGIDSSGIWLDPLGEDSLTTYIHELSHHSERSPRPGLPQGAGASRRPGSPHHAAAW